MADPKGFMTTPRQVAERRFTSASPKASKNRW